MGYTPTFTAVGVLLSASLLGCHESPPSLQMAETASIGSDEAPPPEEDEAEAQPAASDGRELWFADGPGREAILARERHEYDRAAALLDQVLADASLSPDDRAAAELLRGLEDLRRDEWLAGADRLAKARAVEALRPIEGELRVLEAQARLDGQDATGALALVEDLEPDVEAGVPERVLLVRADALSRTNDREGAIAAYRDYLRRSDDRGVHEARRKLASLLAEGTGDEPGEAASLYERLIVDVPLSEYGREAQSELDRLASEKVVVLSKSERRKLARRKALAEIEGHLDRREYASTIQAADAFVKRGKSLGASEGDRCRALYAKGSAIFKQRKRPAAQPVFDAATKHCKKAGDDNREVKSRYQAARGSYSAGRHAEAAGRFESLANDHADHTYADDCWIKAGESWESHGKPDRARKAYESSLAKHPDGDMADEALRRLLLQAFADGRTQDALKLIDDALKAGRTHGDALAKLHYFRGKALDRLGETERAEDAWVEAIATRPLSYPALQALSRLRDRGDAAAQRGLDQLADAGAATLPELALPDTPAAARVRIWARLGQGERARDELRRGGIGGWPAVSALAQAGLYNEAQKTLANIGSGWRATGPSGDRRALWELAHPLPFDTLVAPGEREHGVPELLTYAIMQTESRFNPGATSWAGARGLIQLMPGTAETVAKRVGMEVRPEQLYDPATNLTLGQNYLGGLTARWGNVDGAPALAIPSYNAGPGRTDDWLQQRGSWDLDLFVEAIPFDETRRYTQSVLGRWAAYRWIYGGGPAEDRMPYIPLTIPARAP